MKPGSSRWWRELGLEPPPAPADPELLPPTAQEAASPALPASAPAQQRQRSPLSPPAAKSAAKASGQAPGGPEGRSDAERPANIAGLAWEQLPGAIESCEACALRRGRRHSVPGVGPQHARWLFVGEGPGAEEDARGEPFVGAAGQLLDSMLAALGLQRDQVYIANVVKCRPPANRTPEPAECAACLPFLERQIALLQPAIIVALGRVAAQALLTSEMNVGSLRGRVHQRQGTPLVVTYHPAYLLRNQPEKARAWADLCLAQRVMAGQAS